MNQFPPLDTVNRGGGKFTYTTNLNFEIYIYYTFQGAQELKDISLKFQSPKKIHS